MFGSIYTVMELSQLTRRQAGFSFSLVYKIVCLKFAFAKQRSNGAERKDVDFHLTRCNMLVMQAITHHVYEQLDWELSDAMAELERLNLTFLTKKTNLENRITAIHMKKMALETRQMPMADEERVCPDLY